MQEYSTEVTDDELSIHIRTAYLRSRKNLKKARKLAMQSAWLWGNSVSSEDYTAIDWQWHSITGELTNFGKFYRDKEYHACSNLQKQELPSSFSYDVYHRGLEYLEHAISLCEASDQALYSDLVVTCDKMKQYLLALFHAVQYPLRLHEKGTDFQHTLRMVHDFSSASLAATNAFYLCILGFDRSDILAELLMAKKALIKCSSSDYLELIEARNFKGQELDQPLTILYSALLAVEKHQEIDIVYALPAGGTQLAIVTRLLYRLSGRKTPEIHYLPVSPRRTQSATGHTLRSFTWATRKILEESQPEAKKLLLCEDNSNTGTTLSIVSSEISTFLPQSCAVVLGEFDPERIRIKRPEGGAITNCFHVDFDTVVGIVPILQRGAKDFQVRKLKPLSLYYSEAIALYLEEESYWQAERHSMSPVLSLT